MVNTPVDHTRKYAIELSMAQVDPSASFEERVAQFDLIWKRWLENISSLLTCARGSSLRNLPFPCLRGFHGHVVSAANEMPDDVVKFLENIFAKPLEPRSRLLHPCHEHVPAAVEFKNLGEHMNLREKKREIVLMFPCPSRDPCRSLTRLLWCKHCSPTRRISTTPTR